jgi:hypothetical protein
MQKQQFEEAIAIGKKRSDCGPENIDTLVKIIRESIDIPGAIAELGSYKCGATIAMAAASQYYALPNTPCKNVWAFDLFGGLPYGPNQNGFQSLGNTDFKEIMEACKPYAINFIKGVHEETVPAWAQSYPRKLSLIFMDSDFYSSHVVCLKYLWPMLSPGGSIVFHDWKFADVQKAIKEVFDMREKRKCDYFDQMIAESQNMGLIRKKI